MTVTVRDYSANLCSVAQTSSIWLSVEKTDGEWGLRCAAVADFDNDGDLDILVININDRLSLYRNDGGNRNHWIGLRLEGSRSNRSAIGTRVEIEAGGRRQVSYVLSGGSYLSQNDLSVHFGLGDVTRVDRVRIRWPNGNTEERGPVEADRVMSIKEAKTAP